MKTDEPVRKGLYGDDLDRRIIALLAATRDGASLREVIEAIGWAYNETTRERATWRMKRMEKSGAVCSRYVGAGLERGQSRKVYSYIRPLNAGDEPPPPPPEPAKVEPKVVPMKSLPPHLVDAVEAARSRFDPVEPLEGRAFRLGQFTVNEDELFAILNREPGVLSRVADRFLAGGAWA